MFLGIVLCRNGGELGGVGDSQVKGKQCVPLDSA